MVVFTVITWIIISWLEWLRLSEFILFILVKRIPLLYASISVTCISVNRVTRIAKLSWRGLANGSNSWFFSRFLLLHFGLFFVPSLTPAIVVVFIETLGKIGRQVATKMLYCIFTSSNLIVPSGLITKAMWFLVIVIFFLMLNLRNLAFCRNRHLFVFFNFPPSSPWTALL